MSRAMVGFLVHAISLPYDLWRAEELGQSTAGVGSTAAKLCGLDGACNGFGLMLCSG